MPENHDENHDFDDDETDQHRKWLPPQRYILTVIATLGVIISYTARICWTKTTRHMVPPNSTFFHSLKSSRECNVTMNVTAFIPASTTLFEWNADTRRTFLYSFSAGFMLGNIPAGVLSDKYGPKYFLGFSVLATGILHLVAPAILHISRGHYISFAIMKATLGAAFGIFFPSLNTLLGNWAPPRERTRLSCMVYSGTQFALGLNDATTNLIIVNTDQWSSVYYIYGSLMVFWFIIFHCTCYSKPKDDVRITRSEILFIHKEMDGLITYGRRTIRWKQIISSLPVWALIIGSWGQAFLFYLIAEILPEYETQVLGINFTTTWVSSLPYWLTGTWTIIDGFLADYIINKEYIHITTVRKMYTTFGSMGPALLMLAASYAGCHSKIPATTFIISMCLMSCSYAGLRVNTLDLAPNFSGTIMSLVNGFTIIMGNLASLTVKKISVDYTFSEWRSIIWVTLGILTVTNIVFMMFGTGETQWWNNLNLPEDTEFEDDLTSIGDEHSEASETTYSFVKGGTESHKL